MKIFSRTGRMRNLSDDDIQHTLSFLNINPPLILPPQLSSEQYNSDQHGCVSGDCCDINRICDRLHGCSHSEHHPSLPGEFCQASVSVSVLSMSHDSLSGWNSKTFRKNNSTPVGLLFYSWNGNDFGYNS